MIDKDDESTPTMDEMSNGVKTEQQIEAFQSSGIVEDKVEDDAEDEEESQESLPFPIERNRKLTRAPIFREIVKKVIAENLRNRMIREANEKGANDSKQILGAICAEEPDVDISDGGDRNQSEASMKDADNENNAIQTDDASSLASSHRDSPRYEEDENDNDNGDIGHTEADKMTAIVAGYELKINYLEEDLKKKKVVYEQKLSSLIDRVNSVESRMPKKGGDRQNKKIPTHKLTREVGVLRKALSEQFSLVDVKIDQINDRMQTLNQRRDHLFEKAEIDLENIKHATENKLSEVYKNLEGHVENTLERSDNTTKLLNGMKCELVGTNNDIDGRIREILSIVTEQRRKYKSKFLEVETEAARMKIMVNATKGLLENVQNSLEDIEGGKRNNLIFHGVVVEHPETQIRC